MRTKLANIILSLSWTGLIGSIIYFVYCYGSGTELLSFYLLVSFTMLTVLFTDIKKVLGTGLGNEVK